MTNNPFRDDSLDMAPLAPAIGDLMAGRPVDSERGTVGVVTHVVPDPSGQIGPMYDVITAELDGDGEPTMARLDGYAVTVYARADETWPCARGDVQHDTPKIWLDCEIGHAVADYLNRVAAETQQRLSGGELERRKRDILNRVRILERAGRPGEPWCSGFPVGESARCGVGGVHAPHDENEVPKWFRP